MVKLSVSDEFVKELYGFICFSAFCYMIYEEILRRRGRVSYKNECCFGPETVYSSNDDDSASVNYEQSSETIDYSAYGNVEDETETEIERRTSPQVPKVPPRRDLLNSSDESESRKKKHKRNAKTRENYELKLSRIDNIETSEDERRVLNSRIIFRTSSYSEALRHKQISLQPSNRCHDEPNITIAIDNRPYYLSNSSLLRRSPSTIVQIEENGEMNPNDVEDSCIVRSSRQSNEITDEKKEREKRARARFRWFFLYTVLHNYQLLDLSKTIPKRIHWLYIQRYAHIEPSIILNKQKTTV